MDSGVDASTNDYVDMTSRHAGVSLGETLAPREPLSKLADETGGRALFNLNSINDGIRQAVDETSEYYVVGWRPDADNERKGTAKLEISIAGRPDLKVRVRKSYPVNSTASQPSEKKQVVSTPEAQLLAALGSSYSQRGLPVSISVLLQYPMVCGINTYVNVQRSKNQSM